MTRCRRRRFRATASAVLATFAIGLLAAACSISAEETPRPINRETTVVPPSPDAP